MGSFENERGMRRLTIVEVGHSPQDTATCVQRPGFADSPRRVPSREQNDLGVDEPPGGYGIVQRLSQGECASGHLDWCRHKQVIDSG